MTNGIWKLANLRKIEHLCNYISFVACLYNSKPFSSQPSSFCPVPGTGRSQHKAFSLRTETRERLVNLVNVIIWQNYSAPSHHQAAIFCPP